MKYTWDDKIRPTLYTGGEKRGTNSADRRKRDKIMSISVYWATVMPLSGLFLGSKDSYHETLMSLLFVLSNIWGEYQIFLKETIIKTQQSTSSFYLQNDLHMVIKNQLQTYMQIQLWDATRISKADINNNNSHALKEKSTTSFRRQTWYVN